MRTRHEFEDEDGNETELTDITYEVMRTYVDIDNIDDDKEPVLVFTHIVRVRPESIDLHLKISGLGG